MAGLNFLNIVSNSDLVQQEEEGEAKRAMAARQSEPLMLGLGAYLRSAFDAAERAKDPIETSMLKALRQRSGQYEADK